MRGEGVERDEWLVGLQLFMDVRLRTVPFHVASRNRPGVSVPLPIPNTQYIMDGIMWSVRDYIAWAPNAWLTIQNHLQSCSQRYTQLAERLSESHAHNNFQDGAEVERERLYSSHAYVQDLYVAFCAVDAFLRHVAEASQSTAREAAEKELPRLVADHMPIWQLARSQYMHDAVEDYRLLFLDVLRSWTVTKLLRPDTHRRIEEYVRYKLKTLRDNSTTHEGDQNVGRRSSEAISAGLRVLLAGAGPSQSSTSSLSSSSPSAPATIDVVRRNMREFVVAIFPSHRSDSGRKRCAHCGAIFRTLAAKIAHYRYHFYNRSYLTGEKIVRLPYPTLEDYISHEVTSRVTGDFVRVTENLLDVLRVPEKRTVHVRKEKQEKKPS
ncbi:hypothetical protein, conserved [Trypanosoma cruzi]|uniref:C2H2-type domain-containing protein n=1 Tax=Trypanosoma cruzi (strain CL Brener) TaxID=353153 RepID=Q4CR81_TRYCC|nr:uncharacterized protein Tc00.1047053505123.20 [Trypanosoma cruzi]EAN82783.1 hypothetical protein, conserved [Trypanosoma cruzi]|eukprot:XP_804634.1 hypothetical protein Tc00.1047053505123.20 [Trypanosoma cruzi strain CL Brener]